MVIFESIQIKIQFKYYKNYKSKPHSTNNSFSKRGLFVSQGLNDEYFYDQDVL